METLRSYLTTAMLASVASAICIRLADERFQKYVKYIAGLCILALLAKPLYTLVEEMSEQSFTVDMDKGEGLTAESGYLEALGGELSDSIGDRVARQNALPREAIYVTLTLNTADLSSIEIESIDLIIKAECDEKTIEQALSTEFACKVHVREVLADATDR